MPLSGATLAQPVDLFDVFRPGLDRSPDDDALVSAEMRWTWRALDQVADRLGANLLALGLRPGDRVATLMPNRTGLLIFYAACFRAGLVATPLNYRYTAREIDHALTVSGASLILAHAERKDDIAASEQAAKLAHGVVTYGAEDSAGTRYESLITDTPSSPALPRVDPTDPALIFFTSGSTGRPKGVTHTYESAGWIFASTAGAFEMTPEDIMMPGSSMSHIGGFLFAFSALSTGARVVVPRAFDGHELLPLLRAERPTIVCMIPTPLMGLVREHGATRDDFRSLRICRSGSDKVPAELEQEFEALTGFPIDEGYGMTEVGLATLNPPSGVIKLGSIGTPNPSFEMSVRDDNGQEVPVDTAGKLWMKTPAAMAGYWNSPSQTEEVMREGWLDSGDIMKVDEDGYLWFCGRKKQIIVHDGSNIYPQEVEEALLEHPGVENAGVIGIHDLIHGEIVRAYVEPKQNVERPHRKDLMQFARDRIGYKAPEEIEFLDQIPLNPTGKIDRVLLKEMAAKHH